MTFCFGICDWCDQRSVPVICLAINTDDLFTQIEIDFGHHTHTPAGSLPSIVYKQYGQTEIQSWLFPQLTN